MEVVIFHSDCPERRWAPFRVEPTSSVADLKTQVHRKTGTVPDCMQLTAKPRVGDAIRLDDESRTLASYGAALGPGFDLTVVDTDPSSVLKAVAAAAADNVPKFELTDEQYAKRSNVREFIKQARAKMGPQKEDIPPEAGPAPWIDQVPVGARCELLGGTRGEIAWKGRRPGKSGVFLGVVLDEPLGDTDGCDGPDGPRLFTVPRGRLYGRFVRVTEDTVGKVIKVGDDPTIDVFEEH